MSVNHSNELIREMISKSTEQGAQEFVSSVRAIYGTKNGKPKHIGTCMFVQIRGTKYILTAAHIIDHRAKSSLYVQGDMELVLLEEDFICTPKPESGRDDDHYDFAWSPLSHQTLEKIGNIDFIEYENISTHQENADGRLYLALGYPKSKNKKVNPNKNRTVTVKRMKYSSTLKYNAALCEHLGISGREHLFLDYNSLHSMSDDWELTNSFSPIGISGGPLIDMGCMDGSKGLVAGMLIENYEEYKVMLAVKIDFIVDQIIKYAESGCGVGSPVDH